MELDIDTVNKTLRHASADEIVQWALSLGRKTIATTSMGRNAAVMLHVVAQVDKSLPTIWVDTFLLYKSYAADDLLFVDFGGCRNIHTK